MSFTLGMLENSAQAAQREPQHGQTGFLYLHSVLHIPILL
jgi:hypothetical protein